MVLIDELIKLGVGIFGNTLKREENTILRYSTLNLNGKPAIRYVYAAKEGKLRLSCLIDGKPYQEEIRIEQRESNLGVGGHYYYFLCPQTGRRCRYLYLYGGRFVSRYAIPRVAYPCQRYRSKLTRSLEVFFGAASTEKRYGKEQYRGKLTPYGKKLLRAYNALKTQDRRGG